MTGASQIRGGKGLPVHALELKPDLPAAQLQRSELVEHQADVKTGAIAAEVRQKTTPANQALEPGRVLILEQLLRLQLRVGHVSCLPAAAGRPPHNRAVRPSPQLPRSPLTAAVPVLQFPAAPGLGPHHAMSSGIPGAPVS
jgi:hypothetical protein